MLSVENTGPAKAFQQRQQRKTEDREEIALDAVEQPGAETFEVITADGPQNRRTGGIEIGIDLLSVQRTHRKPCCFAVLPDGFAAEVKRNRGNELMIAALQSCEMGPGPSHVTGLVETPSFAHQYLVGADDRGRWVASRDIGSLCIRQPGSELFRRNFADIITKRAFIDIRRHHIDLETGVLEHAAA